MKGKGVNMAVQNSFGSHFMWFAFRSEAEEGASRRRWASCKEGEAATPQAYSLYAEDVDAET